MPDDSRPFRSLLPWAIAIEGGLGVAAVGLGWLLGYPVRDSIPEWRLVYIVLGVAATLPMLVGLWVLVRLPWRPFVELLRVVNELIVPLFGQSSIVELAVVALLAGLGEEMLFRGVIQRALIVWISGPSGVWIGLGVTSVLFGLCHAITKTYLAVAGVMGLYLGWLLLASGNLLVPVTAHTLYDFLALVYLVRGRHNGRT